MAVRSVDRMPIELWTRTFGCLKLSDIIRAAHVSRSWRLLAFDDVLFWRDVTIHDVSDSVMNLAAQRLAMGYGRPMTLDLDYRHVHASVRARLMPLLRCAVPRARRLCIRIESIYRLDVEDALCQEAPLLEHFQLFYDADPPDLHLTLPLAKGRDLFADQTGRLRKVDLVNVILPSVPAKAFAEVTHVSFNHALTTFQEEFPCYLWEAFPNMVRLRLTGGECWFKNAPLPDNIVQALKRLKFFDIGFRHPSLPGFFTHLPMNDIPEVMVLCADDDAVYAALDPLRSPFHMVIHPIRTGGQVSSQFIISVRGQHPWLFRHLSEPFHDYYPGSDKTNPLFDNEAFAAQLADFTIHSVLWAMLAPWLPSFASLPKLIVIIDDDCPDPVQLPSEALLCPNLDTLVLQAHHKFVYLEAEELLSFVDRITPRAVTLELRRVLLKDPRDLVRSRFEFVTYYDVRIV